MHLSCSMILENLNWTYILTLPTTIKISHILKRLLTLFHENQYHSLFIIQKLDDTIIEESHSI